MPKAYWIAHVDVHDPERYKLYVEGAAPVFVKYRIKFLARGGDFELMEGEDLGKRHVVGVFDSMETAKACYHDPGYQAAREHRLASSKGTVMIVEGAD